MERLPESYLNLKPSIYLERKKAAQEKLSAMQQYCQAPICRAQQLITYFGQQIAPCGTCDVCLPRTLTEDALFAFLQEAKSIDQLEAQFLCSKAELEPLIRPHLLTEKIKFKAGKFYL